MQMEENYDIFTRYFKRRTTTDFIMISTVRVLPSTNLRIKYYSFGGQISFRFFPTKIFITEQDI